MALDISHAYYYQIQCQLGVSETDKCFFVVWTPDRLHVEEIQADTPFFEENVIIANTLIEQAIPPEIIGCWFTKPRQGITDSASETVNQQSVLTIFPL